MELLAFIAPERPAGVHEHEIGHGSANLSFSCRPPAT
jgi:hypothetical protein